MLGVHKSFGDQILHGHSSKYFSDNEIEKTGMGKACNAHRRGEKFIQMLVGKPKIKRPHGRPRRRWEDDIKMDLQEVGRRAMDWIVLAQDRY